MCVCMCVCDYIALNSRQVLYIYIYIGGYVFVSICIDVYMSMYMNRHFIVPCHSRGDVVGFLAERYDTKSNVKLTGIRSYLQAPYVSSLTKGL